MQYGAKKVLFLVGAAAIMGPAMAWLGILRASILATSLPLYCSCFSSASGTTSAFLSAKLLNGEVAAMRDGLFAACY